jgi:integrase
MAKYTSYTKKSSTKKFWRVKGYLGTNQKNGEVKYFCHQGFTTKLDAKDAYEAAQADFKAQTTIEKKITRVHFRDVYEEWWPLYKPNVEASTSSKVKKQFENHILPELGDYFVDAISIMDAEAWTLDVSKRYVRWDDFKARASQIMRFAVRCGYIKTNPFDYIQNPRKGKVANKKIKQNWFDLKELQTFMETLRTMSQEDVSPNQQWAMSRAFLSITASTGMRRSEVRALKWSDINWDTGELKVQRAVKYSDELGEYIGTTKTVSGMRQLLLDGDALDALQVWKTDQLQWRKDQGQPIITKENWIFTSQNNPANLMSADDPTRWMATVCKTAGVHQITLHGLRHTKATLSSQAGADIADIAAVLGHSNGRFTLGHYIHQTKSGVIRAESLFNKYVTGDSEEKKAN